MHELGDLEIARVAQAAWTALSYILPNHEPIKAWANLPDTERAVMLTKVRDMIKREDQPLSMRVTGLAEMNPEDVRKHLVIAGIVELLKLGDDEIKRIISRAQGNDYASNLVPMDSKLTPGHEGATENEQDMGPIAAATGGAVSGVQPDNSGTQQEPGTTKVEELSPASPALDSASKKREKVNASH